MEDQQLFENSFGLAAALVSRSRELIADGWVKGKLRDEHESVFCVLGALDLAGQELMLEGLALSSVRGLAERFILGEMQSQSIPGWNDSPARRHEEVLAVLDGAARSLWNVAIDLAEKDNGETDEVDLSAYTPKVKEEQKQYLYNVLN